MICNLAEQFCSKGVPEFSEQVILEPTCNFYTTTQLIDLFALVNPTIRYIVLIALQAHTSL
jgi:hypothetical protein